MSKFFKSQQTTAKYHFERQTRTNVRKRLRVYLQATSRTGIEVVNVLKRFDAKYEKLSDTGSHLISISNLHAKFIVATL